MRAERSGDAGEPAAYSGDRDHLDRLIVITRNMEIVRSGGELTRFHAVRLSPEGEAKRDTVNNVVKVAHGHGQDDAYDLDPVDATY